MERGNLFFALHALTALSVEKVGELAWLAVADERFLFHRLSVLIMQWTREERLFCVEALCGASYHE